MSDQTTFSINFGTREVGTKRLQLYKKFAKERGYSLSAMVVKILDKEFGVKLPEKRPYSVKK